MRNGRASAAVYNIARLGQPGFPIIVRQVNISEMSQATYHACIDWFKQKGEFSLEYLADCPFIGPRGILVDLQGSRTVYSPPDGDRSAEFQALVAWLALNRRRFIAPTVYAFRPPWRYGGETSVLVCPLKVPRGALVSVMPIDA